MTPPPGGHRDTAGVISRVVLNALLAICLAMVAYVVLASVGQGPVGDSLARLRPDERGISLWKMVEALFFAVFLVPVVRAWWRLRWEARRGLSTSTGAPELSRRVDLRSAYVFAVVASLALAAFRLLAGPFNNEDLGDLVIYHSELTVRAMLAGALPYWNHAVALGIPLSHAADLAYHPLSLLFLVLPLDVANGVFTFAHILLALVYTMRTCRLLAFTRPATVLAVVTMTFSGPVLEYTVVNSWPSLFLQWAFVPVLFYYLIAYFHAPDRGRRIRTLGILAVGVAFVFYNSHPGFSAGLFATLVIFGLVEVLRIHRRAMVITGLVAATFLVVLMSGDKLLALATELGLSPAEMPRNSGKSYSYAIYEGIVWELFVRPLVLGDLAALRDAITIAGPAGLVGHLATEYTLRNADWQQWGPFFGPPFAVLACLAIARPAWVPHRAALGVTFVAALTLLVVPPRLLGPLGTVISGTVAFRDPLVFVGTLLGAGAFSHLQLTAPRGWHLPRELVVAQVACLALAAAPVLFVVLDKDWYSARTGRLESPLRNYELGSQDQDALRRLLPEPSARLWNRASPLTETQLLDAGFTVVSSGVRGVTLERLYPSPVKMYGGIKDDERLVEHAPLLDVLGIRYLLTSPDIRPPDGLERRGEVQTRPGRVVMLENSDAWPRAVFVSHDAFEKRLARRQGCSNDRYLCSDFGPALDLRHAGDIAIREQYGDLRLRFEPSTSMRTILYSGMYRPGWQARAAGRELTLRPALEELIGIEVPAGIGEVQLEYRPAGRVWARWLGLGAMIVALACIALGGRVRRGMD